MTKSGIFYLWLGVSLLVGGMGFNLWTYGWVLVSLVLVLGIWRYGKVEKIVRDYGLVMLLMGVIIFWSALPESSMRIFLIFLIGGGWLWVGSLLGGKKGLVSEKKLALMVTMLGLVWLVVFVAQEMRSDGVVVGLSNLTGWSTHTRDHSHLGDWWALVVLGMVWSSTKYKEQRTKNKALSMGMIAVGLVIIYISRSRSAVLSLLVGLIYLYGDKYSFKNNKNIKWVGVLGSLLFILLGISKRTFFNRQYWVQGILGWWRHPLGLGMGSFGKLSEDVSNHFFGLSNFATVAFNLPLEILVGMGVLGFYFWWWLYKYVVKLFVDGKIRPTQVSGLVVALGVNFMFDSTYFVAPMWWVFLFLVGVMSGRGNFSPDS